jgi:hypothetical protein
MDSETRSIGRSVAVGVVSIVVGIALLIAKIAVAVSGIDENKVLGKNGLVECCIVAAALGVVAGVIAYRRKARGIGVASVGLNLLALLIWLFVVQL